MTPLPSASPAEYRPVDDVVRRQIAQATLKLRRYRLARDRAQMERLQSVPRLASMIALLLDEQAEAN